VKAQNLGLALKYFSQQSIGLEGTFLDQWYVDRAVVSPDLAPARKRLENMIRNGGECHKYLFIGDRGAGKSTELNRLAKDLEDRFSVIRFSAVRATGRGHQLHHADLLLAILLEVNQQCIARGWLPKPVGEPAKKWLKDLSSWWQQRVSGMNLQSAQTTGEANLSTILGEVQLKIQRVPVEREQMLEQVEKQANEYIGKLNEIARQAKETNQNKPLVVIIEDIDKVSDQTATEVFLQHTQILLAPKVGMIYTFPNALRYSPAYAEISKRFQSSIPFPNFVVAYPKSQRRSSIPSGVAAIEKIILRRLEPHLIAPDALQELIQASGGVPYWVVKMVNDAAANALAFGKTQIELSDVRAVQTIVRNDFSRQLEVGDLEFLAARHKDNSLLEGEKSQTLRLMYIGALIEYENGGRWCDVHYTLLPLLPKRKARKP
jgi:GTPase SAR1 family protein